MILMKRSFEIDWKFILKSIQNCGSYGLDKSLTFKCDLDLGPTITNTSNPTYTHDGQQLGQTILKSIHNYRCHGPDKFGRTHSKRVSNTPHSIYCLQILWGWISPKPCSVVDG